MFSHFKPAVLCKEILGVPVRVSARARQMSLSVDPRRGDVVLTLPRRASERSAARFIESRQQWIENCRAEMQGHHVLRHGGTVAVAGNVYTIVHRAGRGVTRFDGDTIVVHGMEEHVARRLKDFLKVEAKEILHRCLQAKLERLECSFNGMRVIDPKSRWGSCSPEGVVMFSWRLVLTPPHVLDYVVAHEAAHRIHMNHSRRFWKLCYDLSDDAEGARAWLKTHGRAVMGMR